MKTRLKAFTLVELLISMVIVALLTGVIFTTYQTILNITVRVENEKVVANEMLFAHQTIQNLVDNYTIDYTRYNYTLPNHGTTGVLYLTGRGEGSQYQGSYEIRQEHNAIILVRNGGARIPLTDSGVVRVSDLSFSIVPYNAVAPRSDGSTIPIGPLHFATINDIYHPGFWMRGTMYIRNYKSDTYIWSVKQSLQSFFNIRSY